MEGLLRAGAVDDTTWGSRTAMTLPALTTTPREMARALDRVAGDAPSTLIDWGTIRPSLTSSTPGRR